MGEPTPQLNASRYIRVRNKLKLKHLIFRNGGSTCTYNFFTNVSFWLDPHKKRTLFKAYKLKCHKPFISIEHIYVY